MYKGLTKETHSQNKENIIKLHERQIVRSKQSKYWWCGMQLICS